MKKSATAIDLAVVTSQIFSIRGQRVILSFHLAEFYRVEHRALIQAVARNRLRFPKEFLFKLTPQEFNHLKSQIVTSSFTSHGGLRSMPYAFTEHGAMMAATVLRSARAIRASVEIIRAFVSLRRFALTNRELARKLAELEVRYDGQFEQIFAALRALFAPAEPLSARKIGFHRFD